MQVSKTFVEKREISYKNITTEFGTKLRMNRSIQVEGAFGVLKSDYEFNRFLTRGKNSVKTEFKNQSDTFPSYFFFFNSSNIFLKSSFSTPKALSVLIILGTNNKPILLSLGFKT